MIYEVGGSVRTVSRDHLLGVASDVLGIAARNGLGEGSRLPTERELATKLQLTRTTIRNVMALLEEEGIVSREVGRGTFLRSNPRSGLPPSVGSASFSSLAVAVSPSDVMTARQIIEPAAMVWIVENATINDFDEIERCLQGSENATDYDEVESWDLALHRAFIRASHNPLMENMYLLIDEARQGETWGTMKRRSDSSERREHYRQQHRAIAEALRDRDSRAARDAMQHHLENVGANLQGSVIS
jgi:DNA-binding FadR family transcriptional regulator